MFCIVVEKYWGILLYISKEISIVRKSKKPIKNFCFLEIELPALYPKR